MRMRRNPHAPAVRRRWRAVALAVAALTVGFNLILGNSLSHNANDLARARASAQLAALSASRGRLEMGEAPDEALGQTQLWVFSRGRAIEAPRAPPAGRRGRAGRSRAARREFLDVDTPGRAPLRRAGGLRRAAPRDGRGRRLARSVRADPPHDADRLARVRAPAPARRRGRRPVAARGGSAPGRAHDARQAAAWSEREPRPPLRARRAARRADARSLPRSTACSTGSPPACATSSASRPSSRTSCGRRSPGSWPRPSSPSARAARVGVPSRARGRAPERAAGRLHDRGARRRRAAGGRPRARHCRRVRGRGQRWPRRARARRSERGVEPSQVEQPREPGPGRRRPRARRAASSSRSSRTRAGTGARRVALSVDRDGSRSSTWSRTTGPASASEERERIFEPGRRGAAAARRRRAPASGSRSRGGSPAPPRGEVEAMPNGAGGGRFTVSLPTA